MITTISNLYPRPDQPTRGLYNYYLFREMGRIVNGYRLSVIGETDNQQPITNNHYLNICLVPEWRMWRWPAIRKWEAPAANGTVYVPVFTLPFIGRSWNWIFYRAALRHYVWGGCPHPPCASQFAAGSQAGETPAPQRSLAPGRQPPSSNQQALPEMWGGCPHPPCSCQVPPRSQADGDIRPTPRPGHQADQFSTTQQPTTNNPINGGRATVYVPWLYPDGVAAASAVKGTGARLWLMALGSDTFHLDAPLRRNKILEACRDAVGIVCVANVLADRLAAAGVPRAKLHVVPNGVDAALFRVRNKAELSVDGYSLSGDTTNNRQPTTDNRCPVGATILFIGNLVPVKGPEVLLEAFALLTEKRTSNIEQDGSNTLGGSALDVGSSMLNVRCSPSLLLIGDGPMRKALEHQAKVLGIADRVRFLGRLPPGEVAEWMSRADCLCLPSRSEGMPNVVLEARACGCPVVATPAGACPELPLSREGLLITRDYTAEALAEGLKTVLEHPPLRTPDQAIPSWHEQARKVLDLIHQ